MKNIKILVVMLISTIVLPSASIYADNRISLRLKPPPKDVIQQCIDETKGQSVADKIVEENTPGQISMKLLKNGLRSYSYPSVSGFMAIYSGYMDISSKDGLLEFPLRHATSKIYIAIAPSVELVKVKGETISHREFTLDNESKLYLCERKVDEKKNAYWSVKEEKISENKKINPITLVIFAKTKNIYLPEVDVLATESSHLVLPDLYVIGNFDQEKILLQALDLKRYFEDVKKEEKKAGDITSQEMIINR
jgi:hypothetical protein